MILKVVDAYREEPEFTALVQDIRRVSSGVAMLSLYHHTAAVKIMKRLENNQGTSDERMDMEMLMGFIGGIRSKEIEANECLLCSHEFTPGAAPVAVMIVRPDVAAFEAHDSKPFAIISGICRNCWASHGQSAILTDIRDTMKSMGVGEIVNTTVLHSAGRA